MFNVKSKGFTELLVQRVGSEVAIIMCSVLDIAVVR